MHNQVPNKEGNAVDPESYELGMGTVVTFRVIKAYSVILSPPNCPATNALSSIPLHVDGTLIDSAVSSDTR